MRLSYPVCVAHFVSENRDMPNLKSSAPGIIINVALSADLVEKLEAVASASGAHRTQIAALAIAAFLEDGSENPVIPCPGVQTEAWEGNTLPNWQAAWDARLLAALRTMAAAEVCK